LKLGTKLTLYLSAIIVVGLSGVGYFHIQSRQNILNRKMKVAVKSIGQTMKVSLEKGVLLNDTEYVQELIDSIEKYEKTVGVIVYHQGKAHVFRTSSLEEEFDPYVELIKRSIKENRPIEKVGVHQGFPVFSYSFPLKDGRGTAVGGVSILQHTSLMEEDLEISKWGFLAIFVLIGGTVALVLVGNRKWIHRPISQLVEGIKQMARGQLSTRIDLKGRDELFELAQAFNQMAVDLKDAREKMIREAETRLELERSLRQSEKLATIGQLASGLAHEIGTPLNIIGGRVELTKSSLEDKEEAYTNLDIISNQTIRITKIIEDLLGFAKKKKPEETTVGVAALLETTLDFVRHQVQKQGVQVEMNGKEDLPPVKGDSDQLQQVFLNLILNAIQSMPRGGTLRISLSSKYTLKKGLEVGKPQFYAIVSIEDTGAGMEQEVIQNIFNPFFTTKDKGTGLGLTISQGIVRDHEGWIEVESEMGKGSTFRIYLPASQKV
jgi:signal transduction histidine kinase